MIKISLKDAETFSSDKAIELRALLLSDNFMKKEDLFRTTDTGEKIAFGERWVAKGRPTIIIEYKG